MDAFQYQLIQNPYQVEYSYSNIMQIIAAIEEYRYYLEHLDRLRLSFFTYHRNDTDIEIQDEDFDLCKYINTKKTNLTIKVEFVF